MRKIIFIFLTVLLGQASLSAEPLQQFKVGEIIGLTGPMVEFSNYLKDGALLAAEDLRQDGVVDLKIIFEDSEWQATKGLSAYKKLAEFDKVKVFYINSSGVTLAIKPVSEKEGNLVLSLAAHPDIINRIPEMPSI